MAAGTGHWNWMAAAAAGGTGRCWRLELVEVGGGGISGANVKAAVCLELLLGEGVC